jgi:hypothetical protein
MMTSLALLVVRIRVAEEPDVSTLAWPSRASVLVEDVTVSEDIPELLE